MKKNKRDEPTDVIIHIYKETPCVATFISNKQECHFFFHFSFLFYKIGEKEGRTDPAQVRFGTSVMGQLTGKGLGG
jgi:hypothetical protein